VASAAIRAAVVAILLFAVLNGTWGAPVAAALAGLAGLVIVIEQLVPRQSTRAWATGALGELRTAQFLDPLADEGYVVMHDLRIPMSRANIDHLVIGPTGVFVVETKNIVGALKVRGGDVTIRGRRIGVVDEVKSELEAVWNALGPTLEEWGVGLQPVICAHRADLPWFKSRVAGIPIVSGRGLVRLIRGRSEVLSPEEVGELRHIAERRLPVKAKNGDPRG
jgi:hypothetical protein